jgi:hypothetical protein
MGAAHKRSRRDHLNIIIQSYVHDLVLIYGSIILSVNGLVLIYGQADIFSLRAQGIEVNK